MKPVLSVREFITSTGKNLFREWLDDLENAAKERIQARILRFETGNLGDIKSVGCGVLEARLDLGPGYRLYFGRDGHTLVILLCAGDKKTQRNDIVKAKGLWRNYQERKDATKKR